MSDATYKIVYEGYPVLTIGTTDKSKIFHPFGLAITYEEQTEDFEFVFKSIKETIARIENFIYEPTTLIADNAPAITNGFNNAFKSFSKRVSCWAHVIRNIDINLKPIKSEQHKTQIRIDICKIQLSISEVLFKKSIELFFIKWNNVDLQISNFFNYFDKQ